MEGFISAAFRVGARLSTEAFRYNVVVPFKRACGQFRLFLVIPFEGVICRLLGSVRAFRCFFRASRVAYGTIAFDISGLFGVCLTVRHVKVALTSVTYPATNTSYASYHSRESNVFP